jgi:hypothetical protein
MALSQIILISILLIVPALSGAIFGYKNAYDKIVNILAYIFSALIFILLLASSLSLENAAHLFINFPYEEAISLVKGISYKGILVTIGAVIAAILPFSLIAKPISIALRSDRQVQKTIYEHFAACFTGIGRGASLLFVLYLVLEILAPTSPLAQIALAYLQ